MVTKKNYKRNKTVLDHSHDYTCTIIRRLKASHPKEHANMPGPRVALKHTSLLGSRYTCPSLLLIIRRITWRRLCHERAYIRVNLLHRQGTQHFSQHFLHFLSLISQTDLSVGVLTCLQAPFVPPQKMHRRRTRSSYRSSEHSLQLLRLNYSYWTDHLALEGGDRSLNHHGPTIHHCNRFQLCTSPS
jgi:hypothetical protein